MVNYLERARALAECPNNDSTQSAKSSGRLSKISLNAGRWRSDAYRYKLVEEVIKNNHSLKTRSGFDSKGSTQSSQHLCCCGLMHAVTGTRIFLLIYVALSVTIFTFGMKSAVLWSSIPFVITLLSVYALCTEKHKYLYPFLIMSGVHIILCILLVLIIIALTAASYPTFRQIVGYSMKIRLSDTFIVVLVTTTVVLFLTLSIIHLWQLTVIYSCMLYFEEKHLCEREQHRLMIAKNNHGRRMEEDGQASFHHSHLATQKCYKSVPLCSSNPLSFF